MFLDKSNKLILGIFCFTISHMSILLWPGGLNSGIPSVIRWKIYGKYIILPINTIT